jgi:hypothetical protein
LESLKPCEKDISLNLEEALDRMDKSSQLLERALLFKKINKSIYIYVIL